MLEQIVAQSIRLKGLMVVLLVVLLGGGVVAARTLPVDAVPDVSTVQVSVMTYAMRSPPHGTSCKPRAKNTQQRRAFFSCTCEHEGECGLTWSA